MWNSLKKLLVKFGLLAAKEAVENAEQGPITVGRVIEPALKSAAKKTAGQILEAKSKKK